jgi:hypothetical protein
MCFDNPILLHLNEELFVNRGYSPAIGYIFSSIKKDRVYSRKLKIYGS